MDVIALYQAGVRNVVASLGTALSDTHARLLKRYTNEVCFVFDGDDAGSRAVERGAPHFLREGFSTKVVSLPVGQDPDDFVQERGPDAFRSQVSGAASLIDFQWSRISRERGGELSRPEDKTAAIAEAAALLRHVGDPVHLEGYTSNLGAALEVDTGDLRRELRRLGVGVRSVAPNPANTPSLRYRARALVEQQLLTLLMFAPQHILGVFEHISPFDFEDKPHQELGKILWESARDGVEISPHSLMETCYDDSLRELIAGMIVQARPLPNAEEEIRDHVDKMVRDSLRRAEQQYVSNRLGEGDADELAVAREIMELSKQRRGPTSGAGD